MKATYVCEDCGNHWSSDYYPLGLKCSDCGDRVYPVGLHHPTRRGYDPEDHDDHASSKGFDRD